MDATRHSKLEHLSVTARGALQKAAALAGVSVDQVVQAGLQRGNVPPGAQKAAIELAETFPGIFGELSGWPFVCQFCHIDTPNRAAPCPFCRAEGCPSCVSSAGCPTCKEAARLRAREAEQARIEREAQLAENEALRDD